MYHFDDFTELTFRLKQTNHHQKLSSPQISQFVFVFWIQVWFHNDHKQLSFGQHWFPIWLAIYQFELISHLEYFVPPILVQTGPERIVNFFVLILKGH